MRLIKRFIKFVFKWSVRLLILILIGLLAVVVINNYMQNSVRDRIVSQDTAKDFQPDCILILGAGVWGDQPSHMLEDRLKTGIMLYKNGVSDRLLMSGDHGQIQYDEVNVMKKYAMDAGVPSEHIFMDHAGFSTYDSMYRARDTFLAKKVVIVTQEYHLYRALYAAKGLGLDAVGVLRI